MFEIVTAPIDARALQEAVAARADGGVVTFLGVVRELSDEGRPVSGLTYEAYPEMALAEFETIALETRERFGDVRLGIVHRVGPLRVGEVAVAVCAAAPHRAEAFDACEWAIDAVKARAAVWKKEQYDDDAAAAVWRSN